MDKDEFKRRISVLHGDITKCSVDVIVNAANTTLLGGGGVDGAIHRAAGSQLLEACKKLDGCQTGEAKMTKGYRLPAKFIIHTVGPVWHGGTNNEAQLLADCYRNSLVLAEEKRLETIAFPAISTGVYGYPFDKASAIALRTVMDFLHLHELPHKVLFVLFDEQKRKSFSQLCENFN